MGLDLYKKRALGDLLKELVKVEDRMDSFALHFLQVFRRCIRID